MRGKCESLHCCSSSALALLLPRVSEVLSPVSAKYLRISRLCSGKPSSIGSSIRAISCVSDDENGFRQLRGCFARQTADYQRVVQTVLDIVQADLVRGISVCRSPRTAPARHPPARSRHRSRYPPGNTRVPFCGSIFLLATTRPSPTGTSSTTTGIGIQIIRVAARPAGDRPRRRGQETVCRNTNSRSFFETLDCLPYGRCFAVYQKQQLLCFRQ